ncbi:MAG: CHAT domain-containing protein [Deltaproteobacteria bacterium]|nr:CHAT domain-containing protein [Deltaproteobacteria bacterium]
MYRIVASLFLLAFCSGIATAQKSIPASHLREALQLRDQMIKLFEQGQYAQAAQIGDRLLVQIEKDVGLDNDAGAKFLDFQGEIHIKLGKYIEAIAFLERAVAIRQKILGAGHWETALSMNNLGFAHFAAGQPETALPLLQQAAAIVEKTKGPDHPHLARILSDLGLVWGSLVDFDKALTTLWRALAIKEKALGSEDPALAAILNNIASTLVLRIHKTDRAAKDTEQEINQAISLVERAVRIREKALGPEHPDTALLLSHLGQTYMSAKTEYFEKGVELLRKALAIQEKYLGPNHLQTLMTREALTPPLTLEALPRLQQILERLEQTMGHNHPDTIITRGKVASLYKNKARVDKRKEDYQHAFQLFLQNVHAEEPRLQQTLNILPENQKRKLIESTINNYHVTLWRIRQALKDDQDAVREGFQLVLFRKGLVLDLQSQTQQIVMANLKGEALKSWHRLNQYRSELARALLNTQQSQDISTKDPRTALQAAIEQEESFLAQYSSTMTQTIAAWKVTVAEIAQRLSQDSALIEFVRVWDYSKSWWGRSIMELDFLTYYVAFVLTSDNHVTMVDLGRIDYKVEPHFIADNLTFQRDLKDHTVKTDEELERLYDVILRPLIPALRGRKRLIISPDGNLNKVPFVALRTPKGRYLIEDMTVSYVTSGRDLLRGESEAKPTTDLLLVANPAFDNQEVLRTVTNPEEALRAGDYGEHFTPLPGTAQEAQIIPTLIIGKQVVLQEEEATESAVRASQAAKVLHLATHGFFLKDDDLASEPLFMPQTISTRFERGKGGVAGVATPRRGPESAINPMIRSGLALAGANHAKDIKTGDDGILTALEVTGMNLSGTDLVVLSACETGVGDVQVGEGIYGLRRAFVMAGAKNLVMSLWAVNDKITLQQMEEFYRGYTAGESPAVALRNAQLKSIATLREQTKAQLGEPIAPVRLWAPFIVQQTGEAKASNIRGYKKWNFIVPLLAFIGLMVLSRMRLKSVDIETSSRSTKEKREAEPVASYARLMCSCTLPHIPPEVALIHDDILIGSATTCDVILRHPSVALQHARLQWRKQGYILTDLQSRTGTYVNGRRISENLLKDGWTVRFGEVEFVFREAHHPT